MKLCLSHIVFCALFFWVGLGAYMYLFEANADEVIGGKVFRHDPKCCPEGIICDANICISGEARGEYCRPPAKKKVYDKKQDKKIQKYAAPPKVIWLKELEQQEEELRRQLILHDKKSEEEELKEGEENQEQQEGDAAESEAEDSSEDATE